MRLSLFTNNYTQGGIMPKAKIRGEQIKDNTITEDDIHDDAIKHFVYGSADLNDNNKPVNWINASNISFCSLDEINLAGIHNMFALL